jgi:hypothetical protein
MRQSVGRGLFLCNFYVQISKFSTQRPAEYDFRIPELNHEDLIRNKEQTHKYVVSI